MNIHGQALCSHEGGEALEEPLHSCCVGGSCTAQVGIAAFREGSKNETNSVAPAVPVSSKLKISLS